MKRNLNKQVEEGKKVLAKKEKIILSYEEFMPFLERVSGRDSEEKINALYELYFIGASQGYKVAKAEEKAK